MIVSRLHRFCNTLSRDVGKQKAFGHAIWRVNGSVREHRLDLPHELKRNGRTSRQCHLDASARFSLFVSELISGSRNVGVGSRGRENHGAGSGGNRLGQGARRERARFCHRHVRSHGAGTNSGSQQRKRREPSHQAGARFDVEMTLENRGQGTQRTVRVPHTLGWPGGPGGKQHGRVVVQVRGVDLFVRLDPATRHFSH